jgi:RimJ/RimL family protein N-acetyltransferase
MAATDGHRAGWPERCESPSHVINTKHLILRTPTLPEWDIAIAAASDPEAQRRLGWPKESVLAEPERTTLLTKTPDAGASGYRPVRGVDNLVAIDPDLNRIVGGASVHGGPYGPEIGGWLAPSHRGRHLGRELFSGTLEYAHRHLGHKKLRAGAEFSNLPSRAALTAAGFVPAWGLSRHILPNRTAIDATWYEHVADDTARCRR